MTEKRELGLKAVHSARAERSRSKYGKIDSRAWLFAGAAVVATLIAAWVLSDRKLDAAKEEILSQQRAAVSTVGAEWFPLRDKLEKITLEAAAHFDGDQVDLEAARLDFRSLPGLYLRVRVAEAKDASAIRASAKDSAKDGFVACLLREPNRPAHEGNGDAGTAGPQHPWNLHEAYRATRVMTEEWANEVKASADKDRLRVFRQQYDRAKRDEIPVAIDILKGAQFFLLVLDEDVEEARELSDGGPVQQEALQQFPHPARVHIVNLRTGALIARLRRTAVADFAFVGEHVVRDPGTRAAMKRQVNNCALAEQVWSALRPAGAPGRD